MKPILRYWYLLVMALLIGCAQLGLPQAETFNQKMAVAYASVTQIRTTASQLLDAKKISADDAQNVLAATDSARAGLDIARKMAATDPAAAENRLTAVRAGLAALASYLATRSK